MSSFALGEIYENNKAKFEIIELGSKIKVKVTKHNETKSTIKYLEPAQFKNMRRIHG